MLVILTLLFTAILVVSNVVGIGVLSIYIAKQSKQTWLITLVSVVTFGVLYCLVFLMTPLEGKLKVGFLERLPYEVGMLLGLGILWIQWFIQVIFYWQRRRYSPVMYRVFDTVIIAQVINVIAIGIIFILCPTIMVSQEGLSRDPATFYRVWLFELAWLTYFSLAFATPLLLLSLTQGFKSWQIRHWIAGLSCLTLMSWWVYWLNYADIVGSVVLR